MSIEVRTPGLHHVSLRSRDLDRSRDFYTGLLGFPLVAELPDGFICQTGSGLVGVRGPAEETPVHDRFDPFRVGLDHFALGCPDEAELQRVARALEEAGVWSTGVKESPGFGAKYVAFKDPDGIKLELWLG